MSTPLQAVPCSEDPPIPYHAPQGTAELEDFLAGKPFPDPNNKLDTPSNVEAIRKHNAARAAVCGQWAVRVPGA